jgi:hypothetical protein
MVESSQDLMGVLLGLVALWFLSGALIRQECRWDRRSAGHHSPRALWQGSRLPGK